MGQADFGKLQLNNIRNDSGNSQRLSVLSAKRDQFETRSIRNKRGRMFRPSRFRGRTRELLAFAILRLLRIRCLHLVWLASCKTYSCSPSTYSGFEIWVLRFRVLGASFSSLGCFIFEFWVLHFRDLGASFSRFGCFVLRSSFSSGSFSKLPQSRKKSVKILLFVQISCNNKLPLLRTNSMANLTSLISGVSGRGHIQPITS